MPLHSLTVTAEACQTDSKLLSAKAALKLAVSNGSAVFWISDTRDDSVLTLLLQNTTSPGFHSKLCCVRSVCRHGAAWWEDANSHFHFASNGKIPQEEHPFACLSTLTIINRQVPKEIQESWYLIEKKCRNKLVGAGRMAQQLRALTAPPRT